MAIRLQDMVKGVSNMQEGTLTRRLGFWFTINELRAPDAVIQAINAKNVMQQQALTAQSLTANLVQYEMMKRWDGKLRQVSSGAMPLIQLPGTRQ